VANHRDASVDNHPGDRGLLGGTFQLDAVHPGFFDMPPSVVNGFGRIGLIRHKRHIADQQRALGRATDRLGVMNHLVHGHRRGAAVAKHDHAERVAHQNHVDAGLVH